MAGEADVGGRWCHGVAARGPEPHGHAANPGEARHGGGGPPRRPLQPHADAPALALAAVLLTGHAPVVQGDARLQGGGPSGGPPPRLRLVGGPDAHAAHPGGPSLTPVAPSQVHRLAGVERPGSPPPSLAAPGGDDDRRHAAHAERPTALWAVRPPAPAAGAPPHGGLLAGAQGGDQPPPQRRLAPVWRAWALRPGEGCRLHRKGPAAHHDGGHPQAPVMGPCRPLQGDEPRLPTPAPRQPLGGQPLVIEARGAEPPGDAGQGPAQLGAELDRSGPGDGEGRRVGLRDHGGEGQGERLVRRAPNRV